MKEYQLGIYPHRNALARDMDNLILLYGMTKEPQWKKRSRVQQTKTDAPAVPVLPSWTPNSCRNQQRKWNQQEKSTDNSGAMKIGIVKEIGTTTLTIGITTMTGTMIPTTGIIMRMNGITMEKILRYTL